MIFCYLLRPIMLESLKNISDGGCCSISLHNFGPQLGQNIQFGPKENFSGNFTLVNLSTYCALSCCKIWKNTLEQILRYKLLWFWATIGLNLPIWSNRGFLWKLHFSDFYLLIVPNYPANFLKNTLEGILRNSLKQKSLQTHRHTQTNWWQVFPLKKGSSTRIKLQN